MSNSSGTKYLRLNELGMNRAERRKMAKKAKKETGKREEDLTIDDVLKTVSANRKKNIRRKK